MTADRADALAQITDLSDALVMMLGHSEAAAEAVTDGLVVDYSACQFLANAVDQARTHLDAIDLAVTVRVGELEITAAAAESRVNPEDRDPALTREHLNEWGPQ